MAKDWCGPEDDCLAELLALLRAAVHAVVEYTTTGVVEFDTHEEVVYAAKSLLESWDKATENTARYLEEEIATDA